MSNDRSGTGVREKQKTRHDSCITEGLFFAGETSSYESKSRARSGRHEWSSILCSNASDQDDTSCIILTSLCENTQQVWPLMFVYMCMNQKTFMAVSWQSLPDLSSRELGHAVTPWSIIMTVDRVGRRRWSPAGHSYQG